MQKRLLTKSNFHLENKNLNKVGTEGNSFSLIKGSKKNLEFTPYLIVNDTSLNIMQKQVTNLITSVQHYIVAKWRKRDIKHSDEKGRSKIPFIQRQYVCLHKTEWNLQNARRTKKRSNMFAGYNINILKSVYFLTLTSNRNGNVEI